MNKMPGSLPNPGNEHSSLQISIKRYNIKAYEHMSIVVKREKKISKLRYPVWENAIPLRDKKFSSIGGRKNKETWLPLASLSLNPT